ncbi:hypothetical protein OF83DRAFT_1087025 [Amylostereum chailletii]|nr:hypothetical protein OF83DRAFT_1087025 [Amylostereum chailletii]
MFPAALALLVCILLNGALVSAAPLTYVSARTDNTTLVPLDNSDDPAFRLRPVSEGGLLADVGQDEHNPTSPKVVIRNLAGTVAFRTVAGGEVSANLAIVTLEVVAPAREAFWWTTLVECLSI